MLGSHPWPCAPWQPTHSPLTPSVMEAAVIISPDHLVFIAAAWQKAPWKLLTTSHTSVGVPVQRVSHLQPHPDSSWSQLVTLQHRDVFPEALQVCSLQAEGDVQPLPESSAHTSWLHLSFYVMLQNHEYLPRTGLEAALAGACLSFFPLTF